MVFQQRRERRRIAGVFATATKVGRDPEVLGAPVVDGTDLEIGDQLKIWSAHRQTLVSGAGRIRIGHRVFLNAGVVVYSEIAITIGDDVALANEVYVMDTGSHGVEGGAAKAAPVVIGDGTWVGARAMVLPGVTIGERAVVAAGAVVTRDVADQTLVAGNPARVVRALTYPPHCRRAWHDIYCYCPGSLLGPALES
jgi:acetyltransferase-like isoleucine patch superfamily enzyme